MRQPPAGGFRSRHSPSPGPPEDPFGLSYTGTISNFRQMLFGPLCEEDELLGVENFDEI